MKNYTEFKEALVQNLKEKYPETLDVSVHTVTKNNIEEEKLTVRFHDEKLAPSISFEILYKEYQKTGDINMIAESVALNAATVPDGIEIPMLTKEEARENIFYQMLSKEHNGKLLEECPFRVIDDTDLVMILRWKCGNGGSFIVKHGIAEVIGVSESDLFEMADDNLNRSGFRLRKMSEVMSEMMGIPETELPDGGNKLYVLTNHEGYLGAACLMGEGTMVKIGEMVGGSYFVLPSSIHELLIIPDDGEASVSDLAAMVRDVNRTEVAPGEVLSDHVYHYGKYEGFKRAD